MSGTASRFLGSTLPVWKQEWRRQNLVYRPGGIPCRRFWTLFRHTLKVVIVSFIDQAQSRRGTWGAKGGNVGVFKARPRRHLDAIQRGGIG